MCWRLLHPWVSNAVALRVCYGCVGAAATPLSRVLSYTWNAYTRIRNMYVASEPSKMSGDTKVAAAARRSVSRTCPAPAAAVPRPCHHRPTVMRLLASIWWTPGTCPASTSTPRVGNSPTRLPPAGSAPGPCLVSPADAIGCCHEVDARATGRARRKGAAGGGGRLKGLEQQRGGPAGGVALDSLSQNVRDHAGRSLVDLQPQIQQCVCEQQLRGSYLRFQHHLPGGRQGGGQRGLPVRLTNDTYKHRLSTQGDINVISRWAGPPPLVMARGLPPQGFAARCCCEQARWLGHPQPD